MGASLLTSIGMEDHWLAHSTDEYIELAVAASQDIQKLAETRAGLRSRMLGSPLCDGPSFVAQLEATYRDLWQQRVKQSSECRSE